MVASRADFFRRSGRSDASAGLPKYFCRNASVHETKHCRKISVLLKISAHKTYSVRETEQRADTFRSFRMTAQKTHRAFSEGATSRHCGTVVVPFQFCERSHHSVAVAGEFERGGIRIKFPDAGESKQQ